MTSSNILKTFTWKPLLRSTHLTNARKTQLVRHCSALLLLPISFLRLHRAECIYCQQGMCFCKNVQNQRNIPQLQRFNYTLNQITTTDNFILHCLHHSVRKGFRLHSVSRPVHTTGSHSAAKGIVARSSSGMTNKCPSKKALCPNSLVHVFKIRFFDTGSCFMLQLHYLPERNSANRHNPQQQ